MFKYRSSRALCCRSFSGSTQPPQQREPCNNPARKSASMLSGFRKKLRTFFSIWRRIHHQPNLQVGIISLTVWFCLKVMFLAKGQSVCLPVCVCFFLKVMFLAKGTVSLFTCLCLFLFKGDVSGEGDKVRKRLLSGGISKEKASRPHRVSIIETVVWSQAGPAAFFSHFLHWGKKITYIWSSIMGWLNRGRQLYSGNFHGSCHDFNDLSLLHQIVSVIQCHVEWCSVLCWKLFCWNKSDCQHCEEGKNTHTNSDKV